jgi:hypothetical protein
MTVSFDLDDTLFVNPETVETEKALKFPLSLRYKERLRAGAPELLAKIRDSGIKLWIYTTSFRSERYIRSYFKRYGIKTDGVVNGQRHKNEVQGSRTEPLPSKYPSKYRIDLHIDDDVSVVQNGKTYGFRVYLINNADKDWSENIWNEILRIRRIIGEGDMK